VRPVRLGAAARPSIPSGLFKLIFLF